MRKNPTEAIVDKDNHLRDALKYVLLSLPGPTELPKHSPRDQIIREAGCVPTAQAPRQLSRYFEPAYREPFPENQRSNH